MKNLLKIGTDRQVQDSDTLLIEIGNDHFNYAFYDREAQKINAIVYNTVTTDEVEQADVLKEQLEKLKVDQVIISSSFPQAILIPLKEFQKNETLLNAIYDLPAQEFFHDSISEWQVIVSYSMSKNIYDYLQNKFPTLKVIHAYTPAIKTHNGSIAENQIDILFTSQNFRVLVKKNQQIQLLQTYQYKAPHDVVYYLLKICYEFDLSQAEVHLIISGLLEKDSSLFKELRNYFSNIQFAQSQEISLPEDIHPHYYFTSLYNLISCGL